MILAQQADALQGAQPWLFYPFAALAVAGAIGVVVSQQIVRTAVALLFTLGSVAFLYFLLEAEFLAVIQLIVYVGGTLILIIFGVMLTSKNPFARLAAPMHQRILGWAIGLFAAVLMIWLGSIAVSELGDAAGPLVAGGGDDFSVRELGLSLIGRYVLPLELAAVLLLVVMIGAAYMAKGRHVTDEPEVQDFERGGPAR